MYYMKCTNIIRAQKYKYHVHTHTNTNTCNSILVHVRGISTYNILLYYNRKGPKRRRGMAN